MTPRSSRDACCPVVHRIFDQYTIGLCSGGEHGEGFDAMIRVLQSFKEPGPRTNPYITQLRNSLDAMDDIEPIPFTWRAALTSRYDVFHAHWPESLIEQRGRVSTFGRRVLYEAFLLRLRLLRIPVVRTVHNLELPQGISRWDVRLLTATERLTRLRIVLNRFTPVPDDTPHVLIEHGHYRDWFAQQPRRDAVEGRLAFFGKIRRYKNVDGLLRAFGSAKDGDQSMSLHVSGAVSGKELEATLRDLAGADPRVTLTFGHIDDPELVREVSEAAVVVLPYPEMHNSGSVLAALSLDRPTLVPENAFNRELAEEMGPGWVLLYSGELRAEHLRWALEQSVAGERAPSPDMSRREWADGARRHVDAYRSVTKS